MKEPLGCQAQNSDEPWMTSALPSALSPQSCNWRKLPLICLTGRSGRKGQKVQTHQLVTSPSICRGIERGSLHAHPEASMSIITKGRTPPLDHPRETKGSFRSCWTRDESTSTCWLGSTHSQGPPTAWVGFWTVPVSPGPWIPWMPTETLNGPLLFGNHWDHPGAILWLRC